MVSKMAWVLPQMRGTKTPRHAASASSPAISRVTPVRAKRGRSKPWSGTMADIHPERGNPPRDLIAFEGDRMHGGASALLVQESKSQRKRVLAALARTRCVPSRRERLTVGDGSQGRTEDRSDRPDHVGPTCTGVFRFRTMCHAARSCTNSPPPPLSRFASSASRA